MKCSECRFWDAETVPPGADRQGRVYRYCRRYPPQLHMTVPGEPGEKKIVNYYWTIFADTDWCGEYRQASA